MKTDTTFGRTVLPGIRRTLRARIKDFRLRERPTADLERVLETGELFIGASPIREDENVWAWFRRRRPRRKRCFPNSQGFILDDLAGYARYYEGYLITPGVPPPIHHAWLVAGGRVFDATLEALDKRLGRDDERDRRRYFGLPFARRVVYASVERNKAYVPLLLDL